MSGAASDGAPSRMSDTLAAYYFDSDGNDIFLCVGTRRIAKQLSAKWVVIAEGWEVSDDLNRPTIRPPLGDGLKR